MKNSEGHHILYQQAQRQTLNHVFDETKVELSDNYHHEITSLQRSGVPAITTAAKIQLDIWTGKI